MDMVKQVDDFIILTISRTNQCLTNDSSLENFYKKILDVVGPLSVLWMGLEGIKTTSEETVSTPVDAFSTLVEKSYVVRSSIQCSIISKTIQYFIQSNQGCKEGKLSFERQSNLTPKT